MQFYACPSCGTAIDSNVLEFGICPACDEFLENNSLSLDDYSLDDIATLLSGTPPTGEGQNEGVTSQQTAPIRVYESAKNAEINYSLNPQTGEYEYKIPS
jgi:hypothetical protein